MAKELYICECYFQNIIMAKKKKRGHYCRICGASKPDEAFSGKGLNISYNSVTACPKSTRANYRYITGW